MGASELGPEGVVCVYGDTDASDGDGDAGADLEELEAEGVGSGARDGIVLQFYTDPPTGTPTEPVFSGALYLYPDDVRALADEFKEVAPFAWGPEVIEYGMREFAIQDPNGYYLAFTEPA